ncbi:MAG TPA: TolC family protein [Synergistaceae bacterium]|nr:TolC family protein [Synergistaceae bacterium]HPJ25836.1 TolC family protein [Synergistaceae bacterium]HPQ37531.1 TolC family protein [Synergistaceae bacterium]
MRKKIVPDFAGEGRFPLEECHKNHLILNGMALFFSVLFFSGVFFCFHAEAEELTLETALNLAMKENPILLGAREQVYQAEEEISAAKAGLGPDLQVLLSYTKEKEAARYPVYGVSGGSIIGFAPAGYEDTWYTALQLTQVLYAGGSIRAGVKAAEFQRDSADSLYKRSIQSVANSVRKAYYDLQRFRAQLDVAEASVELAQEHLKQVEAFYRNGVVAKNEVLRVQVDVSSAELERIRMDNAVKVAWKALERAVGASLQTEYTLGDPEDTLPVFDIPEDPGKLALLRRPEIFSFEFQSKAAMQVAAAEKGQLLPQVFFEGKVNAADDSFFPENDDWTLGISVQWTLFDSGEQNAKAAQAKSLARQLLHELEDLRREIGLEVSTANLDLESATQRVEVAQAQVESAEEDYRMALRRYTAQVGTNIDVLDARVALSEARTALVNAVYDGRSAYSDLLYAIGEDPYLKENDKDYSSGTDSL